MSQSAFCFAYTNYRRLQDWEKVDKIIEREKNRDYYLTILLKFIQVCLKRGIRMIFENPLTMSFLTIFFIKEPDVKDTNRRLRGDYFSKPTGYWYFNCTPTHGFTEQKDKVAKSVHDVRGADEAGICSEERSMISPDYARNFICDFILGKEQVGTQMSLFE